MKLYNKSRHERFLASVHHSEACTVEKCYCTYLENIRSLFPVRQEMTIYIPPKTVSEELPEEFLNLRCIKAAMQGNRPILIRVGEPAKVEHLSPPVTKESDVKESDVPAKPRRSYGKRR